MEHITEVIRGCIQKDPRYQKMVYENYQGYALKIIFRYIYHYENAVYIMNDGFVKLFNSFEKFVPGDDSSMEKLFMGYMRRIMINTAIDELRRKHLVPEIGGIPEYLWNEPGRFQDADQLLLYKDLIILIRELPPQYRIVFNLYVIDGYNHLEIADMLKIPVGTSKANLSRARTLLQKNILKLENDKICSI